MVYGISALLAACAANPPARATKPPAVVVTANTTRVHWLDSVAFVAQIRPDIAAMLQPPGHADTTTRARPHIVGWLWVPDLSGVDPWTKACTSVDLTCTIDVHGSGTMVFSIRLSNDVCAGWVHVEAQSIADIDETDSTSRVRDDSINAAIRTKAPTWTPCTA